MLRRIDVEEKFARQDLPAGPTFQPPDYTALPTGKVQITGIISQEGLDKRDADMTAVKHKLGQIQPETIPFALIKEMKINLAEKFKRHDATPLFQPPDFTVYAEGAKKKGLISQEGLFKREADREVWKKNIAAKDYGKISAAVKASSSLVVGKAGPLVARKPGGGFLMAVDKFFNWLNKVIEG